jgi:hypothetical protein
MCCAILTYQKIVLDAQMKEHGESQARGTTDGPCAPNRGVSSRAVTARSRAFSMHSLVHQSAVSQRCGRNRGLRTL